MNLPKKLNILVATFLVLIATACGTTPSGSPAVTSATAEVATPAKTQTAQPSQPRPTTQPTDSRIPHPSSLEILSHTSYINAGWYHIVGEVRNNSLTPMEFVEIVATLYDDEGTVVGTDFTYTLLDVIPPGDKSPFETGTNKWQGTTQYKLQAQGSPTSMARQDLVIRGDQSYTDGNWLHIAGEVANTGTTPAEFVQVVATLYDASGSVIGVDFTYTTLDIIPAGGTSPFETGTDHWPGFDHYELHVEG